MNNFTVSEAEVSALHSACFWIRTAYKESAEILNPKSDVVKNLKTSLNNLEPLSLRLMSLKDEVWDTRRADCEQIAIDNDFKSTQWSMLEIPDLYAKSTIPAGSVIRSYYTFEESVVDGETWVDVWRAVDRLVKNTSFEHGNHIYIEGFTKIGNSKAYEVFLGS